MMFTVMGATGRTGKRIAEQLLKQGQRVRALGRSADRLTALESLSAEVMTGDAADSDYLARAFHGADAVYTLLPYQVDQPNYVTAQALQGQAIAKAIQASSTQRVVFLSSLGAEQPGDTGMILSLHAQEERLKDIPGLDAMLLRPGSFFENFHGALPLIKHAGMNCDAVSPDLALPMVGTTDIADAAVAALMDFSWRGTVVRELLGPRDLSYAEATRLIGERIGHTELAYQQVAYDEMTGALQSSGFSHDVARLYAEIARGINEGRIRSLAGRSSATSTPSRFEDFTVELAQAYAAL